MFANNAQPDVIIDAEFIEEGPKKFEPGITGAAQRAAHVLESLADTVEVVTPQKANELRTRAHAIKNAGASAEMLLDSGKALYQETKKVGTQVKKLLAQVGIEPELVHRPRGGRRGVS